MTRFKPGDLVLYRNGHNYFLGTIKDIVSEVIEQLNIYNELEPTELNCKYYVIITETDTCITAYDHQLHKIANKDSWLILRHKATTLSINDTPARQLARNIICHVKVLEELEEEDYYAVEDELTNLINEYRRKE